MAWTTFSQVLRSYAEVQLTFNRLSVSESKKKHLAVFSFLTVSLYIQVHCLFKALYLVVICTEDHAVGVDCNHINIKCLRLCQLITMLGRLRLTSQTCPIPSCLGSDAFGFLAEFKQT